MIWYLRLGDKDASSKDKKGREPGNNSQAESTNSLSSQEDSKLKFGPILERTLGYGLKGPDNVLNLATGDLLTMPYDPLRDYQNKISWIKSHEADILAYELSSLPALTIVGGLAVRRPNWDASPTEVAEELNQREQQFESGSAVSGEAPPSGAIQVL